MDESDLRRGKATVHKIYEKKHLEGGFGGRPIKFGESMAIIAGDLADAYAMEILSSSNFPAKLKVKAIHKLNEIIEYTGYGQIIDIYSGVLDEFREEDLLLLHKYKTARYTVEGPIALGMILAGADTKGIENYAIPVGIAFQLQDDILGLFGSEEEIGKPVTSDLAEGKKTLLIIKALENADDEERRKIMRALGNPAVTSEQLEEVRDIVRKTGSLDYSRKLAESMVNDAKEYLKRMDVKDEEMRSFLLWIADYLIKRSY
jgi:geranylgeranyl diphosphate synthase type I